MADDPHTSEGSAAGLSVDAALPDPVMPIDQIATCFDELYAAAGSKGSS